MTNLVNFKDNELKLNMTVAELFTYALNVTTHDTAHNVLWNV